MKLFLLPFLLAVCHLAALEAAPMEETEPGNRERRHVKDTRVFCRWFACKSDGSCVHRNSLCNGYKTCSDGSDEQNCQDPDCRSPGGQDFKCRSDGKCIKKILHCDGFKDCSDGSDEEGCPGPGCGPHFACKWGSTKCISSDLVCDGDKNCRDGSDEEGCVYTTTTTTFRPCTENCVSCPLPYRSFVGACFYWDTGYNRLTWDEAAQKCKDKSGGTLPILYSSEIKKYVKEHDRESQMYVGLTDRSVEGQWKWVDGRDYTGSDWAGGEPNNAGWGRGEDCAEMRYDGHYNDIECDRSNQVTLMCMIIPGSSEKNKKYDIYVGLTDRSVEGQWKWIDGRDYTMDKSDWGSGEPNNAGDEDCVEMGRNGLYNDVSCGADKHVTLMCMIIKGSSGCPEDYTLHGTHCFYWKPNKQYMSWNEAAQQCKDKSGGRLPVLYSSEIKQYVTDQ